MTKEQQEEVSMAMAQADVATLNTAVQVLEQFAVDAHALGQHGQARGVEAAAAAFKLWLELVQVDSVAEVAEVAPTETPA